VCDLEECFTAIETDKPRHSSYIITICLAKLYV